MASSDAAVIDALAALRAEVPGACLSEALADRELAGTDVFNTRALPMAVFTPDSIDMLARGVRAACEAGLAIVVKGGGASYTDGYLPLTSRTLCIDMQRLDRIVSIDEANRTVTVEAGCTWAALHASLAGKGWRTPFFGPFSGLVATVGGSVSQNATSHGSGAWGISAESVIAMDIVLANGEILRTGSAAAGHAAASPRRFFRFYGPDSAGLFTGDCGAFGVKALITLPLRAADGATEAGSFWFADFAALHTAMAQVAELGLDDENFALDIALQQGQIARAEASGEALKIAWTVLRTSPTPLHGLLAVLRMAAAGTRHLRKPGFTVHYICRGPDRLTARAHMNAIRNRATRHGFEIPNTIASVVAAMPFAPLHNVLGPAGERWVPIHGILQHDAVPGFHADWLALLERYRERLQAVGGFAGGMYQAMGPNAFLYEIAFYWRDARNAYHRHVVDADYLASLPEYAADEAARALVAALKDDAVALFQHHGAAHMQLGKVYPYLADRNPAEVALVRAVKQALDPGNRMNPGALGL